METYDSGSESGSVTDAAYYRYYEGSYVASSSTGLQANTNPGLPNELKFAVSGAALGRLMSFYGLTSYADLDNLSDAQIAPYADDYYKFGSTGLVDEIDASGAGCSTCGGVAHRPLPMSSAAAAIRRTPINGTLKRSKPAPTAAR